MTTSTYKDFPFTAYGVKFISRIDTGSALYPRINSLPDGLFNQMNIEAITNLVGNASLLTRDELVNELARANEGGSYAFLLLDEDNN